MSRPYKFSAQPPGKLPPATPLPPAEDRTPPVSALPGAIAPGPAAPGSAQPGAAAPPASESRPRRPQHPVEQRLVTPSQSTGRKPPPQRATVSSPAAGREPDAEQDDAGMPPVWLKQLKRDAPGLIASFVVHAILLLCMAFIIIPPESRNEFIAAVFDFDKAGDDAGLDKVDAPPQTLETVGDTPIAKPLEMAAIAPIVGPLKLDQELDPLKKDTNAKEATGPNISIDRALSGRSAGSRAKLAASGGGSPASEQAVNAGLRWLAKHQKSEGSWSFDHGGNDDPGALTQCTTGATGMALLCFLGAGHTHIQGQGEFQHVVKPGLDYLISKIKYGQKGGDLRGAWEENEAMYAQALGTIALCEAYALTKDARLKKPAQQALTFIVNAQDPKGGGWRYSPIWELRGMTGDSSVTGWQVMALTSGKVAKLSIPSRTLIKASDFFDGVQTNRGSRYGYDRPGGAPSTTSFALLCRMYMGWTSTNPALQQGVEYLSNIGPSRTNIYYNYYGTQIMHHWGGEPWNRWNGVMRDQLVESQLDAGPGAGSWTPTGDEGAYPGGRLYQTCMSIMTLEVYYRHLPMYQHDAQSTELPATPPP